MPIKELIKDFHKTTTIDEKIASNIADVFDFYMYMKSHEK